MVAGDAKSTEFLRAVSNDAGIIFLMFRHVDVMTGVVGTIKARFACTNRWSEMQPASSISTTDSDSAVAVAKMSRRLSSRVGDLTSWSSSSESRKDARLFYVLKLKIVL